MSDINCPLCNLKCDAYEHQIQIKGYCKNTECPIIAFYHFGSPTALD